VATIIELVDTDERYVENLHNARHVMTLLLKESDVSVDDAKRLKDMVETHVSEFNRDRDELLAVCENYLVSQGYTPVPYDKYVLRY
jgi:hypothetical protein